MWGNHHLRLTDFPLAFVEEYVFGLHLNYQPVQIICCNFEAWVLPPQSTLKGNQPKRSMYGIFTYIYHNFKPNVGKYSSPMDPMGQPTFTSDRHFSSPEKPPVASVASLSGVGLLWKFA